MLNPFTIFHNLKLTGAGFVILNVIRVCSIVSLGLLAVVSWIMLVKSVQSSHFFFFDAASDVITSIICAFLVVAELPFFEGWYARNWPLFSEEGGLITLGAAMLMLGCHVLGDLNDTAASKESLGLPYWRAVIAGGIIGLVLGLLNIIAHFLFCISSKNITSRQIRAHGAKVLVGDIPKSLRDGSISIGPKSFDLPRYTKETENRKSTFKFGKFKLNYPVRSSHPAPADQEHSMGQEGRNSPVAGVQVPPPSHHPTRTASVSSRNSKAY